MSKKTNTSVLNNTLMCELYVLHHSVPLQPYSVTLSFKQTHMLSIFLMNATQRFQNAIVL